MTTDTNNQIQIRHLREPTLAECEEAYFNASLEEDGESERPAYPTTVSVREAQDALGRFLVPKSVPAGLTLMERRIGGRTAFMQYREPEPVDPTREKPVPLFSIEQGPVDGRVWILEAKEGHYERVNVFGVTGVVILGTFVVEVRTVDGADQVVSCGWDPDAENSLVFVSKGHGLRLAGSPAEDFPSSELIAVAESLTAPD